MAKIGPNERCPCGSGKKFKKCCDVPQLVEITAGDRQRALQGLIRYAEQARAADYEAAFDEFYEDLDPAELGIHAETSEGCFQAWYFFDYPLSSGATVVETYLKTKGPFSSGERRFLEVMRASSMRIWEVVDVRPGESLTLLDLLGGARVVVIERTASRTAALHDLFAARINPRGPSGGAELETGVLALPESHRSPLLEELRLERNDWNGGSEAFYKTIPVTIHDFWSGEIVNPQVPRQVNADREPLMLTSVRFDVLESGKLGPALDGLAGLERTQADRSGSWIWAGENTEGKVVTLGTVDVKGDALVLEANSVERGARGRTLLEGCAGDAIRHVATVHEDPHPKLLAAVRTYRLTGEMPASPGEEETIPGAQNETLVLDLLARHYREWLDLPVPALDDRTPRAASKDPAFRPRVVGLLDGLVGLYQRALRAGEPAFDPSWMWAELGLETGSDETGGSNQPPPLAHDRLDHFAPGTGEMCRAIARRRRLEPGFDHHAVLTDAEFESELDLRRLVSQNAWVAPHLRLVLDFEIHSRKTFQVDGTLAWMLGKTDIDIPGSDLRLPFPSFAFVFTDRLVLSCCERVLAALGTSPLAGHLLRVVTVYVTELVPDLGTASPVEVQPREVRLNFAVDAVAADPPELVPCVLRFGPETAVRQAILDCAGTFKAAGAKPQVAVSVPLEALLQVVVNAILYATSAGVEPQVRRARATPSGSGGLPAREPVASDEVFYLPGTINITRLNHLRELERVEEGRTLLHRFMVRGHWRRPAPSHKEQRMRWIEPYWKGPDMAATIEKVYRLKV